MKMGLTRCMVVILSTIWLIQSFCLWQWIYYSLEDDFPYEHETVKSIECDSTDLWNCVSIKEDDRGTDKTLLRRLLWVFWLDTENHRDLKFIDYATAIVNMALGLISFVALVMTIYTFYMIFFSDNEEWIKKAKQTLVGIFIALAIIWLVWVIVSFIFRRYQSNWKDKEENIKVEGIAMAWYSTSMDNQIYLNI